MKRNIYITRKDLELEHTDVVILESEGTIDADRNTFAWPVLLRLQELGYRPKIMSLTENHDLLPALRDKPLIIAGGMTEATSGIEWVKNSLEYFHARMFSEQGQNCEVPVLGICFGAQLLAEAYMKGSVSFLRDSEIGPRNIYIDIPEHPLFRGVSNPMEVYEFHYNKVKCDNLISISSSFNGRDSFLQAFQVPGTLCFGLQFHPELDGAQLENLVYHYRELLRELGWEGINLTGNEKRIKPHYEIFRNFIQIILHNSIRHHNRPVFEKP